MFITSRSLRVKRFGRYIRIYTLADRYIYSRSHDLFARWCHDILIHSQILITSESIVGGCRDANWLLFKLIVFISFHRWNFMDVEEATRLFLKLIILFCSIGGTPSNDADAYDDDDGKPKRKRRLSVTSLNKPVTKVTIPTPSLPTTPLNQPSTSVRHLFVCLFVWCIFVCL